METNASTGSDDSLARDLLVSQLSRSIPVVVDGTWHAGGCRTRQSHVGTVRAYDVTAGTGHPRRSRFFLRRNARSRQANTTVTALARVEDAPPRIVPLAEVGRKVDRFVSILLVIMALLCAVVGIALGELVAVRTGDALTICVTTVMLAIGVIVLTLLVTKTVS